MQCPKCNVKVTQVGDVWHCPLCKRNWKVTVIGQIEFVVNQGELLPEGVNGNEERFG